MKIFKYFLLASVILAANFSLAQMDLDKKQMRDGIDSVMKQKVMDKLSLDEATSDKFISTYKENNKQLRILNKEKHKLIETIELDPGASDIDSKLDQMLEIESKTVDQKKKFFNELRTFLTPQQIAKTIILRRKFQKEFRREMMKHRKRNKKNENGDDMKNK
ncbi:MAG: hypothetical protein M3R36_17575 [Bacteroidota bacterium]|nr:hypothetical protein [Bacteroidota bacterium]